MNMSNKLHLAPSLKRAELYHHSFEYLCAMHDDNFTFCSS